MSAPVLTKEQVQARRAIADAEGSDGYVVLADSHEALRAERDAALAEVARLRAALERLGSMEAFGVGGVVDKTNPMWPELEGRIDYARAAAVQP